MIKITLLCIIALMAVTVQVPGIFCDELDDLDDMAWSSEDLVGYWDDDEGHMNIQVIRDEDENDKYIILNTRKDSITSEVGDKMAEVRYKTGTSEWDYTGRHIWGGSKRPKTWWGSNGGIVIKVLNYRTIKVVYPDSKYTGGWVLYRFPR